jgi:hypothetical protein
VVRAVTEGMALGAEESRADSARRLPRRSTAWTRR